VNTPQVGSVYRISNLAQGARPEAHSATSRRPHGVTQTSPDGLVTVVARGTQTDKYDRKHDFWSDRVPTMGLDKDGFFSDRGRWCKVLPAEHFADRLMSDALGLLPDTQLSGFCAWAQR
jgi:hypothetical protein